jgi:hypothetical protein
MRPPLSPYIGVAIALGSMHQKERAIAKPLRTALGATLVLAPGLDTDQFGTFTGEIPRAGSMLQAARTKALAAMMRTGLPYGIGSEGSFGPHPQFPFVAVGTELMVFVDRHRGLEIHDVLRTPRTNFDSIECRAGASIESFIATVKFPSHGLVVKSRHADGRTYLAKGIVERAALENAIAAASEISSDHVAIVWTDMRAHFNPTRMAIIRRLARTLAGRMASTCPACDAPGFGATEAETGLPCAWCGEPTSAVSATIRRCVSCDHSVRTATAGQSADPGRCHLCNT